GLLLCATKARNDDFLAFRLVLAASFVLSPIVWGHYYVLLVVPLAVSRPKLSALWLTAIWIKPDTLQMRSSSAWVTLALLVLLAQLDLASPVSRWWNKQSRPHLRQLTALSALTGLLAASAAGAEAGLTGTTALRPLSRRGHASGVASIRVDRAERQLCWRIWTHDLPARRAAITLQTTLATDKLLTVYTSIGRDGQAQGCAQINRTFAQPAWTVGSRTRYRLGVTVPDAGFIAGT